MYIETRKTTATRDPARIRFDLKAGPSDRAIASTDFDCAMRAVERARTVRLAFDCHHELMAMSPPARTGAHGWIEQGRLTRQARRDFSNELSACRDDLAHYGQALCQIPNGEGTQLLLVQLHRAEGGSVLAHVPECEWPPHLDTHLARVFELTPAETEIMRGVFEHSSVEALAKIRRRTVRTIRTQLSAIYAKTGLKSQADIVRFVAKLAD